MYKIKLAVTSDIYEVLVIPVELFRLKYQKNVDIDWRFEKMNHTISYYLSIKLSFCKDAIAMNNIPSQTFGKSMQEAREKMGLEREEVAKQLKLNEKIIIMLE